MPFPNALPLPVHRELPTVGRAATPEFLIVTELPVPPLTVIPPPLSTNPYPAIEEVMFRFLNPSIVVVPLPSVYTLSSLVAILISPLALIWVAASLITPLSVHPFPEKLALIVRFFAFTSASRIAAPSPRELSVQLITKFRSG